MPENPPSPSRIGVLIALVLVLRPRGLIGEEVTVLRSD